MPHSRADRACEALVAATALGCAVAVAELARSDRSDEDALQRLVKWLVHVSGAPVAAVVVFHALVLHAVCCLALLAMDAPLRVLTRVGVVYGIVSFSVLMSPTAADAFPARVALCADGAESRKWSAVRAACALDPAYYAAPASPGVWVPIAAELAAGMHPVPLLVYILCALCYSVAFHGTTVYTFGLSAALAKALYWLSARVPDDAAVTVRKRTIPVLRRGGATGAAALGATGAAFMHGVRSVGRSGVDLAYSTMRRFRGMPPAAALTTGDTSSDLDELDLRDSDEEGETRVGLETLDAEIRRARQRDLDVSQSIVSLALENSDDDDDDQFSVGTEGDGPYE